MNKSGCCGVGVGVDRRLAAVLFGVLVELLEQVIGVQQHEPGLFLLSVLSMYCACIVNRIGVQISSIMSVRLEHGTVVLFLDVV